MGIKQWSQNTMAFIFDQDEQWSDTDIIGMLLSEWQMEPATPADIPVFVLPRQHGAHFRVDCNECNAQLSLLSVSPWLCVMHWALRFLSGLQLTVIFAQYLSHYGPIWTYKFIYKPVHLCRQCRQRHISVFSPASSLPPLELLIRTITWWILDVCCLLSGWQWGKLNQGDTDKVR